MSSTMCTRRDNTTNFRPTLENTWMQSTLDAFVVADNCRKGQLPVLTARPSKAKLGSMNLSGKVFVFDENSFKRWTDDMTWSPSRGAENYMIYRELAIPLSNKSTSRRPAMNTAAGNTMNNNRISKKNKAMLKEEAHRLRPAASAAAAADGNRIDTLEHGLVPERDIAYSSLQGTSYWFKEGGLMKKTINVQMGQQKLHIVSFYTLKDIMSGQLRRPTDIHHQQLWRHFENDIVASARDSSWKVSPSEENKLELQNPILYPGIQEMLRRGLLDCFTQPTQGAIFTVPAQSNQNHEVVRQLAVRQPTREVPATVLNVHVQHVHGNQHHHPAHVAPRLAQRGLAYLPPEFFVQLDASLPLTGGHNSAAMQDMNQPAVSQTHGPAFSNNNGPGSPYAYPNPNSNFGQALHHNEAYQHMPGQQQDPEYPSWPLQGQPGQYPYNPTDSTGSGAPGAFA